MGSWFSSSKPNEENSVKLLNKNTNRSNGPQSNNSEIFKQIKNIYMQRHAVSCANTIEKVFGKGQKEKSLYAKNSKISYVGVQQCLQVSDYFSKNPIESGNLAINNSGTSGNTTAVINNSGTSGINGGGNNSNRKPLRKPLLIFCCSELIRTQQTLFLSWIRYLKDYKERKGKIIVIPWLNEVSAPKIGSWIPNKDNYPASFQETKLDWIKFIQNLRENIQNIKADTLNPNSRLVDYIDAIEDNQDWDKLFYLSPVIYKENATNRLSNNSKKIQIRRKGIIKKMGDMDQFIGVFSKILQTYINDPKQEINMDEYDGIELVIVAHHNSAEYFMEFVMPSTHAQFKEIQLVNCEVVKLPGQCLQNFVTKNQTTEPMIRVFPMNFNNDANIFNKNISIIIDGKSVYPLFILYISSLDLFLSVNNIVKTRLKGKGVNERVQIKKPLYLFLQTSIINYRTQLAKIKIYIKKIQENYEGKNGSTFYDYNRMLEIIGNKLTELTIYTTKRKSINKQLQPNDILNSSIQNFIENKMNNQLQPNTITAQNEMNKMIKGKVKLTRAEIHEKLKRYLFDFCELKPEIINSIAVF